MAESTAAEVSVSGSISVSTSVSTTATSPLLALHTACCTSATTSSRSSPTSVRTTSFMQSLAKFPIAVGFTYAAWLAHDYVHGTDAFCNSLRHFGAFSAGLSTTMWYER